MITQTTFRGGLGCTVHKSPHKRRGHIKEEEEGGDDEEEDEEEDGEEEEDDGEEEEEEEEEYKSYKNKVIAFLISLFQLQLTSFGTSTLSMTNSLLAGL